MLAVTSDPAAKGSAKDLEVAGAGPVHCHFSLPPSFLTMCSSERCLSLASPWYIDHLNQLVVLWYFHLSTLLVKPVMTVPVSNHSCTQSYTMTD